MAKLGLTTLNDVIVWNAGSLSMVRPLNDEATAWLQEHTDGQWLGDSLAVEWRYVNDLIEGLRDAGFTVK